MNWKTASFYFSGDIKNRNRMVVGLNSEGHNYNTYKHQVQLGMLESKTRDAAYVIKSTGFDATCGLICCTNDAIECRQPPILPEGLHGIMTLAEFNQICGELNHVFEATVVPMFPCFCTHFCIPFSPMCAILYCRAQRRSGVKRVLDNFNHVLKPRGAYFESIVELDYIAQLRVDRAAHQQYLISTAQAAGANYSVPSQQHVVPAGYMPQQQMFVGSAPPPSAYGPGAIVPTGYTQQYATVPQYAPVGGYSNATVVPIVTSQYVQPMGVVPMSMEKR